MTVKNINSTKEYYEYVEFLVDCIVEEYEEYSEEIPEMVFDTVDSSEMIMYYSNNLKVLQYSNSDPQEWKHLVSETDYWKDVIQAMAFDVLRTDIYEEINERGIDY